jgi:hypothetical protein
MKKQIFKKIKKNNSSKPTTMSRAMTRPGLVFLKKKEKFKTQVIDLTKSIKLS